MTPEHNLLSWNFLEYPNHQRQKSWYIFATLIFLAFLAYAILTANFLFGLIIIMVAIIIFINHNKEPRELTFSIVRNGILIENNLYRFKEIKKFWLLYEPPQIKNIYFELQSGLMPILTIPLAEQNPLTVRKILKDHLQEDLTKENESTADALARYLKL
ncbi:MAG TPA: hypothetical protein PLK76_00275 [bacterium]|nr:hypothetical protein [bacterium]